MQIGELYGQLLDGLARDLPEVEEQLREEVKLGRPVSRSQLPESEQRDRRARLQDAQLQGLGKGDVAVVPYTEDEQLDLLCDALVRLAATMHGSRQVLLKLLLSHDTESTSVQFNEPEGPEGDVIMLQAEEASAATTLDSVRSLLRPWMSGEAGAEQ